VVVLFLIRCSKGVIASAERSRFLCFWMMLLGWLLRSEMAQAVFFISSRSNSEVVVEHEFSSLFVVVAVSIV